MSQPKPPSGTTPPTEPPEFAAERERLLAELEKQARATTGTTQAMLRKLHEVVVHTKPGVPVDFQLYADAKVAFERFIKDPVLPLPAVLGPAVEFMQKRAVAMGWTGKMQLPKGAPPPPPGLIGSPVPSAPAPSASAAPAGGGKDGFEGSGKAPGSVALNPSGGEPLAENKAKAELQSDARLKTPGGGNLRG